MNMMRSIVFFLFGLTLALPVVAQNITPAASQGASGNRTNELFDLNVSVTSPNVKTPKQTTTPLGATVIPDGFKGGLFGAERESSAVTNAPQASKLSFLMSAGVEYADEGEYEDAERAYLRALELDPESEGILFRMGALYVTMERFPDAVRIFENLAERFPESPLPHNNLAWCYAIGKGVMNKTKALRHAREAILSAPYGSAAWNTLAESYYSAGDYKKALRSSEYAIELLQAQQGDEETLKRFEEQRVKILRAQEAMKLFGDE